MAPDIYVSKPDEEQNQSGNDQTEKTSPQNTKQVSQDLESQNENRKDPGAEHGSVFQEKYHPKHAHTWRHVDQYSEVLANEAPTKSGFRSYAPKPLGIRFESQHADEIILMFLRQHPIVMLPWLFIALIMLLAPLIFFPLLPFMSLLPGRYLFVFLIAWYLFTAGFLFERLLMWLFNSFIITDERMIDIDFYSLIFKETNYAQIDKIQDVNLKTGGVIFSLLDIGSIFVQTAAEVPEFVFENIWHPARVSKLLNELIIEEEREKNEGRVR